MASDAHIRHPLDPLSTQEVEWALTAVKDAVRSANSEHVNFLRFCETVLIEPAKDVVALVDARISHIGSTNSSTNAVPVIEPPRLARVVTYNKSNNETIVWTLEISFSDAKVASFEVMVDVQPPMDGQEYVECEALVKSYPPFQDAMRKRGVEDMDLVMVDPWCVGYFSEQDHPRRRLSKPIFFVRTPGTCSLDNGYARPVEGVFMLVDMQRMQVVEFQDRELVPLPPADPLRNYTEGSDRGGRDRDDVKPLLISQPEGPSFRVQGYLVEWQKFRFRVGFTPKEGLVLHTVSYEERNRGRRKIAHRLSFCEMVVPYGDPRAPHFWKNAFDAGEDGLGRNAHELALGCDCLGEVRYFDAALSSFAGQVAPIRSAICLHEEDSGVLWKHVDWRSGHTQVRRSRRLTVSFFCTVANYEYGFFWHFYQDGKIEAEVKLTGILSVGSLRPGENRKYGTVISRQLYAPVHQHFFVARLDMDVDGPEHNEVVEVNVRTETAGAHNPHNNAFFTEETVLQNEAEAARDCNAASTRFWKIQSTVHRNRTGAPTAYKLVPGLNSPVYARPDALFLRRAPFLLHHLWVTPWAASENFPGGDFPNQNPRVGDGLVEWRKQGRRVQDADVVLWYVFGLTHVVRPEDWPVMPVEHIGFVLQPEGFFDSSPAIDVPPSKPECVPEKPGGLGLAKL